MINPGMIDPSVLRSFGGGISSNPGVISEAGAMGGAGGMMGGAGGMASILPMIMKMLGGGGQDPSKVDPLNKPYQPGNGQVSQFGVSNYGDLIKEALGR